MRKNLVLLVEDKSDDEALMLDAVRQSGADSDIIVLRDGAEALDYLFREGRYRDRPLEGRVRLVLLDLKLPKVGGHEVLRRLREHEKTRFLPVVILSSSSELSDIRQSYALGANSYIRKPIGFDHFSRSIACLCEYWLSWNQNADHEEF